MSIRSFFLFTEFFCGDKCKYIDFRNIRNFEINLLFLATRLLKDKAFRKGLA